VRIHFSASWYISTPCFTWDLLQHQCSSSSSSSSIASRCRGVLGLVLPALPLVLALLLLGAAGLLCQQLLKGLAGC
jgi:hypothetical protein